MRRAREIAPPAQATLPFVSQVRLGAKAPATQLCTFLPLTPRWPPKHCFCRYFALCPPLPCAEADPLSWHLSHGSWSSSLAPSRVACQLGPWPHTWSGLYLGGIHGPWYTYPEPILRTRWLQIWGLSLRRKEERGLQGRKGLSGPRTKTGSPDLTETPLLGLIHCFQTGCPCPGLINKT